MVSKPATPLQTAAPRSALHALLDERAESCPDKLLYRHLTDGDTHEETHSFGSLARQARGIAAALTRHGANGRPVLVIHPPGLAFIEALFACWYAGAIAVPAYPPRGSRHRQRLHAILEDSGARLALASDGTPAMDGVQFIRQDGDRPAGDFPAIDPAAPALLQYTSGSTAAPKGVMISHRNFRSHFASLACYDALGLTSAVSWLPPYHDMGLVLKILYAFEAAIPLTFFSPDQFVQRPARWLRAISRFRADLSGAPNFAFDLCLRSIRDEELEGVNLSCWKAAPCGAERVRPETLESFAGRFARFGFNAEAFRPGYGLAETTLIVTANQSDGLSPVREHSVAGRLVSSGTPLPGVELRIADPSDGGTMPAGNIGEIRIKAPVVSQGYWQRPEETRETFGDASAPELRSGDLGFIHDGHLYVTSRIKDLIIIDGTNHAPEDIESIVLRQLPEVTAAAAFSSRENGRENVSLTLEAARLSETEHVRVCAAARRSVATSLEVPVHRVVIVRAGILPRTTSGKIRRAACRDALEHGSLRILHDDLASPVPDCDPDALATVLSAVAEVTGRHGAAAEDDILSFGMSSLDATRLAAILGSGGNACVSLGDLFAARSFEELAISLRGSAGKHPLLPEIQTQGRSESNTLTHAQERMWFLQQLDPQSAAYHVFGSLELMGELSVADLHRALDHVVSQHEILRSRHGAQDGRPRVWIDPDSRPPFEVVQCADPGRLAEILRGFARTPFDLARDSPIRALLVATGPQRHILAICVHHIAADGWSIRLLGNETAIAYQAIRDGGVPPSPAESPGYLDYAAAHREWADSGALDAQIDYWKSRLADHPGILHLPTDFPRPHAPSSDGDIVERALPPELCNRIAALGRSHRATPFMVHLAAFLLLLRQHGGGSDPMVAIPVANRNHASAAQLVGTLVNTLPFRLDVDPSESFSSLIERVREASLGMQENQDAPFERIIDAVKPDRASDHTPLVQVMFDHQEIPVHDAWANGLRSTPHLAHRGAAQFELSLLLTVFNSRQQLGLEYRSDLFRKETIAAILDRHLSNLERLCQHPELETRTTCGLTDSDHWSLQQLSHGPQRPDFTTETPLELIARRVAKHPERTAVECSGASLDYQTLATRSDHLAASLLRIGVKAGDRVAILLRRDLNLPVALLAVWKAGAAYVPLDRTNPAKRLALILADQDPLHILVAPGLGDHLPTGTHAIVLDDAMMDGQPAASLPAAKATDPAYVIYTSGSTGKPKGVVVPHSAVANFLRSMAETPGFTEADRLLAITTVSFDISVLEIFLPLISGGTLELLGTTVTRDGNALRRKLESSHATVMQATPATWRLLLDAGWQGSPDLKILCGGEAMDLPLATELVTKGCQLWNLYGPTETTVWSSCWRVPQDPRTIRIGSPIANTGLHIVSDDGSLLPPGVPGNLWIAGSGLAEGYWLRPDLTESRFVSLTLEDGRVVRAYQTGDIARRHADGSLECLGRSDGQVKIRGFRVELGEIETTMGSHPQIGMAKVALRGPTADARRLVGWISLKPDGNPPDPIELRAFLAKRLPVYMIPAEIGVIDRFPLNSNGKVDLSQLDEPESIEGPQAPRTATEDRLIAIWSELLARPLIHPGDNWFHIGGHSLLALRLFARIHQDLNCELPLSAVLDHPTPHQLAKLIDSRPNTHPRTPT